MKVSTARAGRKTVVKRERQTPVQIIRKPREADAMLAAGKTIGQVTQALQISEQTFHRRRNGHRREALVAVG